VLEAQEKSIVCAAVTAVKGKKTEDSTATVLLAHGAETRPYVT
jgi:hypothetical protein